MYLLLGCHLYLESLADILYTHHNSLLPYMCTYTHFLDLVFTVLVCLFVPSLWTFLLHYTCRLTYIDFIQ